MATSTTRLNRSWTRTSSGCVGACKRWAGGARPRGSLRPTVGLAPRLAMAHPGSCFHATDVISRLETSRVLDLARGADVHVQAGLETETLRLSP